MGFFSFIVPADDLLAEAQLTAESIASKSLPVLYAAKEAVRAAQESSLAEGLRFEQQVFTGLFALEDQTEGMTAFVEKRKPEFKNR